MSSPLIRLGALAGAALAVAGCTTYDNYGYRGGSIGYSARYASPYYGWYDGYYYPGTGYHVYNRAGSRERWNDNHRRYWEARRGDRRGRDNWSGYGSDRRDRRHRR